MAYCGENLWLLRREPVCACGEIPVASGADAVAPAEAVAAAATTMTGPMTGDVPAACSHRNIPVSHFFPTGRRAPLPVEGSSPLVLARQAWRCRSEQPTGRVSARGRRR